MVRLKPDATDEAWSGPMVRLKPDSTEAHGPAEAGHYLSATGPTLANIYECSYIIIDA
jgi:hypothetical protein